MDSGLARELGGARIRLLGIWRDRYERTGMGVWSQVPYETVVWVRTGCVRTSFDAPSRTPMLREAGSVVFHSANLRKRSEFISGPTEFVIAGLSLETASGFSPLSLIDIPHAFPEEFASSFRSLLARFLALDIDLAHPEGIEEIIEARMMSLDILRLLLRSSKMRMDALELSRAGRIRPIIEELSSKFNRDLDISKLAAKACLSVPQFYRQFKAFTGLPPLEYVIHLRLREASRLLLETDGSVREISGRVGWEDQFHFSRMFKAAYGMSPLNYRGNAKSRIKILV
jgi:AraC-like DNA-binding protein